MSIKPAYLFYYMYCIYGEIIAVPDGVEQLKKATEA